MIISSIIGVERTLRKGHPPNFTVGKQAQGRQELVPGHTVAVRLPWEEAFGGPEGKGGGLRAMDWNFWETQPACQETSNSSVALDLARGPLTPSSALSSP